VYPDPQSEILSAERWKRSGECALLRRSVCRLFNRIGGPALIKKIPRHMLDNGKISIDNIAYLGWF